MLVESFAVREEPYDFCYDMYHIALEEKPSITLNPEEHTEYTWLEPVNIYKLEKKIHDLDECVKFYESWSKSGI